MQTPHVFIAYAPEDGDLRCAVAYLTSDADLRRHAGRARP
jgi:hypothetical protein